MIPVEYRLPHQPHHLPGPHPHLPIPQRGEGGAAAAVGIVQIADQDAGGWRWRPDGHWIASAGFTPTRLARLIPAKGPFERDVKLFGWKLVHIPPMCKVNPLYDQLVALRFPYLRRLGSMPWPPIIPASDLPLPAPG